MKKTLTSLLFFLSIFAAFGQKAPSPPGPASKEEPMPIDNTDVRVLSLPDGFLPGVSAPKPAITNALSTTGLMVFREENINSPNNTAATAMPLGGTSVKLRGSIFPVNDIDFYSFNATAGDRVYAATMTAFSAGSSTDSQLSLIGSDGTTIIEFDDDNGSFAALSSSIAGAIIPTTGTYYLKVNDFSLNAVNLTSERPYDLYLKVQSGSPTPEVEGNDTPGTANDTPSSGWISGARNPAAAAEQDWYAITLGAGESVFLSLDLDPERDGVTWNGRLGFALFGDGGNQILVVDDAGATETPNTTIPSEAFFFTVKEAGTYYLFVDSATPATGGPTATYNLSVSKLEAIPGYTSYTSTDVPKTIGPGTGSVTSTLTIPDTKIIKDLAVRITLNHALMQDVDAILTTPEGNQIALFTDIGSNATGGQTQMDLRLDDYNGVPPTFPVLKGVALTPENVSKLDQLKGMKSNGTWTLTLYDDLANTSGGTLTSWSLDVLEDATPATLATATTIYNQDFESGAGGFTHSGTIDQWALGTPNTPATTTANPIASFTTANSGVNCWKTNLTGPYSNSSNQALESADINLTGVTANTVTLSWAMKYQMESASFDNLTVYVEEVGGSGLTQAVFTWLGATQTATPGNPIVNTPMASGWGTYFADISAFKGKIIRFKVRLTSDNTIFFGGVAIDDVKIFGDCTPPAVPVLTTGNQTTICTGSVASLSATCSVGTVNWYDAAGTGLLFTGSPFTTTALTANTIYNVRCENGSCVSPFVSTTITVTPTSVGGTVAGSTTVCAGVNSTTLTLTGNVGAVQKWQSSLNPGFSSPADIANMTTSLTVSNLTQTTYYRAVVKSGACSEAFSATAVVTVAASPTATISGSLTVIPGGSTTLTAAGGTSQTWSTGETTVSISVTAGTYSVTVANASGCTSSTSVMVTEVNGAPIPTANANQTATVGVAFSYTVNAFTDNETPTMLTYTASIVPMNGFMFNPATRVISGTPSMSGVSSVTVTASDPSNLSASTSFTITVSPAPVTPPPTATFSITGVTTISCQTLSVGQRRVTFNPRYAGLDGTPVSFSVVNEMPPTTNPGPYTLNLYTDNPVITLRALQSGASNSFAYNWLSACSSSTGNTPPTVANPVPPQSATVGIAYTLSLANVFTDAETPSGLSLSVMGLPAGLNFVAPSTISGTPSMSGVSSVTVTATDPGSLSASTSFTITVSPAGATPPPPSGTFSITGVTTVSCEVISAGQRRLTFNPRYAGLNGAPVSFSVVNELAATTSPGPYVLRLYTDNPVITLQAVQSGISSSFAYNWLSACSSSTANTAPTVANPVTPQSATVGVGYTLSLATVFTDAETPNQLSLSVVGLPAGLSFTAPSTISGTPSMSGVSSVTVTATDPGSLSASTSFTITVSPAGATPPPPSGTFSFTGVQTVSCEVVSAGQRRLTFNPRYAGLNGAPVSFSVANELAATTNPGPYVLRLYTDNPVITLQAVQSGVSTSFAYSWLAACNGSARVGAPAEVPLRVRVLGNPLVDERVTVEVRGAESQALSLTVVDERGNTVSGTRIDAASSVERVMLTVGRGAGVYLLRVSSGQQVQTLKLVKQ